MTDTFALDPWLTDSGSLTQRLIRHCDGQFAVIPLSRYRGTARPIERQMLDLPSRTWCYTREVLLTCRGKPAVFARTLIPPATLAGKHRRLLHLGKKSLGSYLFAQPDMRRDSMIIDSLEPAALPDELSTAGPLPGRCSLFMLGDKPLLVCEYFFVEGLGQAPAI